jgi:hypothetical protein
MSPRSAAVKEKRSLVPVCFNRFRKIVPSEAPLERHSNQEMRFPSALS